jgi:hypothetical protein
MSNKLLEVTGEAHMDNRLFVAPDGRIRSTTNYDKDREEMDTDKVEGKNPLLHLDSSGTQLYHVVVSGGGTALLQSFRK